MKYQEKHIEWIRCIINEIFPTITIPVICLTDSKTLYHAVKSSKQIADKRLSIDLAMIKDKCENNEIENIIWISKEKQIADNLTKKGASCEKLIQAISC